MPARTMRSTGSQSTSIAQVGPWQLGWPSFITNSAAFGNIENKADLVQVDAPTTNSPQPSASAGSIIRERPAGEWLLLMFVLQSAAGAQGNFRIWSWEQLTADTRMQWHPRLVYTGTAVAGLKPGIAGGLIDETSFYWNDLSSPIDRTWGAQLWQPTVLDQGSIVLAVNTGSAALFEVEMSCAGASAMNFLYCGGTNV